MSRVSIHQYFINIAREVATRATCPRKHVGAVIVKNKQILATGYNGSVSGLPHCEDEGCILEDTHCIRTVHAESNAIIQSAKHGVKIEKAEMYITASPCWHCFKLIASSGIKRIIYGEFYRDQKIFEAAKSAKVGFYSLDEALSKSLLLDLEE